MEIQRRGEKKEKNRINEENNNSNKEEKDAVALKKSSPLIARNSSSSPGSAASPLAVFSVVLVVPEFSSEKGEAARSSCLVLQEVVLSLPHAVPGALAVRSFGRIWPEYDVQSPPDADQGPVRHTERRRARSWGSPARCSTFL